MEEKIFLEYPHGKLCAIWYTQKSSTVVILCHGLASSKASRINQALRPLLHQDGMDTLALDLYAHGESDGAFEQLTLTKAYDGLKRAYMFAKEKGYTKILFAGSSFSGIVCMIGAARLHPAALVLKCPVFDYAKLWKDRLGETGMENWKKQGYVDIWEKRIGYGFYSDALTYDVRAIASSIQCPVLFVHGDADGLVSIVHSQEAYALLPGEKKLHAVKGADHFYKELPHFKEMVRVVHDWIREHVQMR